MGRGLRSEAFGVDERRYEAVGVSVTCIAHRVNRPGPHDHDAESSGTGSGKLESLPHLSESGPPLPSGGEGAGGEGSGGASEPGRSSRVRQSAEGPLGPWPPSETTEKSRKNLDCPHRPSYSTIDSAT